MSDSVTILFVCYPKVTSSTQFSYPTIYKFYFNSNTLPRDCHLLVHDVACGYVGVATSNNVVVHLVQP